VIDDSFAAAGLGKPRRGMVCESFLALPGIVARSAMLATIPQTVFEMNSFRPELCEIPVTDALPSPTVCVVRRHDLPLTPAASRLIGWVRHYALKGDAVSIARGIKDKIRAVTQLGVDYAQGFQLRSPEHIDSFEFLACGVQPGAGSGAGAPA
jgi:hypothetical protein